MGSVNIRTSHTSQGSLTFNPYNGDANQYAVSAINLGSNPLSKLEIVSSLNSFNIARWQYHYNYGVCTKKYNLKVYLGAVQSVAEAWQLDNNTGIKSDQKSGSLLQTKHLNLIYYFACIDPVND